jgi:uncharacterized membrane protein
VTGLRWHQAQALAFDADGVAGSSTALDVTSDAIEVTHQSSDAPVLAGSVVYLVGAIGLTIAYHVPRNEALAAAEPQRSDAARQLPDRVDEVEPRAGCRRPRRGGRLHRCTPS